MSKNKKQPIEPEIVEEVKEEVAKEATETEPKQGNEAFIARTLKAINKMENSAKAERLANRLLRKRR